MANYGPGCRISNVDPTALTRKLDDFGHCVGDLVTLHGHGLNSGGVIYMITRDSRPVDAMWGTYRDYYKAQRGWHGGGQDAKRGKTSWTWCYVNKKGKPSQPVPETRLKGCIELTPVFSLFPTSKGKKVVPYRQIKKRVMKVDIVRLGVTFYEFQTFLQGEAKRLSGE
jgi:hypothetical protein